jgi:hypothetical protein
VGCYAFTNSAANMVWYGMVWRGVHWQVKGGGESKLRAVRVRQELQPFDRKTVLLEGMKGVVTREPKKDSAGSIELLLPEGESAPVLPDPEQDLVVSHADMMAALRKFVSVPELSEITVEHMIPNQRFACHSLARTHFPGRRATPTASLSLYTFDYAYYLFHVFGYGDGDGDVQVLGTRQLPLLQLTARASERASLCVSGRSILPRSMPSGWRIITRREATRKQRARRRVPPTATGFASRRATCSMRRAKGQAVWAECVQAPPSHSHCVWTS